MDDEDFFAGIDLTPDPKMKRWRTEPLSVKERLIINNIFDSQPEKRKAYLQQIGLEANPEDDNVVRPIGSDTPWEDAAKIDPGVGADVHKLYQKGGIAAVLKEHLQDAGDIALDTVKASLVTAGGAAGALAGIFTGPMAPVAAVAGGVLGAGVAESGKQVLADIYLDKNIPTDYVDMAASSVVEGTLNELGPAAAKAGTQAWKQMITARKNAVVNAASKAGNGLTPDLIVKASQNPEMFTKEATDGAFERMGQTYKQIFGLDPDRAARVQSTRQINPDSLIGQKVNPLNDAATKEIDRLAMDANADFTVGEILSGADAKIAELSGRFDLSHEEREALKYLEKKRQLVLSKAQPAPDVFGNTIKDPYNARINFKQGRDFLKAVQDDAFNREIPGSSVLKQIAGGGPNGLRAMADAKATAAGSNLAEINAQRSKILDTFNLAQEYVKPSTMMNAFVGKDSIQKSQARQAFAEIDGVLGSNIAKQVEDGSMQAVVENAFKVNPTVGSSSVNSAMVSEAISQGWKGATAGGVAGTVAPGVGTVAGAVAGGIAGAARGARQAAALHSPSTAIGMVGELGARERAINELLSRGGAQLPSPVNALLSVEAGEALSRESPAAPIEQEDENFFD